MAGQARGNRFRAMLASIKHTLLSHERSLTLVNTLLMVVLLAVFFGQKKALEPVVFNQGLAIALMAKELNHQGLPDAKARLLIHRFARALPHALNHFAKDYHVVIFQGKEVQAGAPDVTSLVLPYIVTQMRQQNVRTKRPA